MARVNNIFDETLGGLLRNYRKERGLSMESVANRIGCTKQMVSLYELGKSALTVTQLMKICNVYGLKYYEVIREAAGIIEKDDEI